MRSPQPHRPIPARTREARRHGLQIIRRAELGRSTPSLTLEEFIRIAEILNVAPALLPQAHNPPHQPTAYTTEELTVAEARLLRSLQTGRRSSRSMSAVERQFILPSLQRLGVLPSCYS